MSRTRIRLGGSVIRRLESGWRKLRAAVGTPVFLCDSCMFDYRNACRRWERPNAIDCPDYRRR
jgi:hypothetical protein